MRAEGRREDPLARGRLVVRKLVILVAGLNRFPRHKGGKDSSRYFESGSGSLARFRRGGFVPASVRRRSSRRILGTSEDRRGGINVSDFQVHVFDLSPGVIAAVGARR